MLPKSNPPCIREFMWPWCIILLNPASLGWTIWTLLSWVWENLGLGSGLPLYLSYNPNFLNWYELLKRLHWLLIEWWIRFKLACLVHKILNTGHPPYLTELIQYYKPSRSTRSSVCHLLSVHTTFHLVLALSMSLRPKYRTLYLFTSANLKLTLPSDVILRRTTLFQPISPPSGPCNAPWFSSETWCYINNKWHERFIIWVIFVLFLLYDATHSTAFLWQVVCLSNSCLFFCGVEVSWSHRLEFFGNNFTVSLPVVSALFRPQHHVSIPKETQKFRPE